MFTCETCGGKTITAKKSSAKAEVRKMRPDGEKFCEEGTMVAVGCSRCDKWDLVLLHSEGTTFKNSSKE